MEKNKITIHTDGGSRGNPGPAAIGVVIEGPFGKKEYGEHVGETTNNEAEYKAVIFALKKLKQLIGQEKAKESEVKFVVDSELLAKQMNQRQVKLKKNRPKNRDYFCSQKIGGKTCCYQHKKINRQSQYIEEKV